MTDHPHVEGCLLCAVRQLTEGTPPGWVAAYEGDKITGVVVRTGETNVRFGYQGETVSFVDLWTSDNQIFRVVGYSLSLRQGLMDAEIKVGDTVTVRFDGLGTVMSGKFKGKPYKRHTVTVTRGHH